MAADGPSVLVTLRLSARDRALLEQQLVERERQELEDLGVEVSLSSVMRKLIRAAAKASAVDVAGDTPPPRRAAGAVLTRSTPATPSVSQDQVRALLRKKMAERRGLGAELARRLGVERAQVSRFKAGAEAFPVAKLARYLRFSAMAASGDASSLFSLRRSQCTTPQRADEWLVATCDRCLRPTSTSVILTGHAEDLPSDGAG
jgi:hypothetical protein